MLIHELQIIDFRRVHQRFSSGCVRLDQARRGRLRVLGLQPCPKTLIALPDLMGSGGGAEAGGVRKNYDCQVMVIVVVLVLVLAGQRNDYC